MKTTTKSKCFCCNKIPKDDFYILDSVLVCCDYCYDKCLPKKMRKETDERKTNDK